MPINDIKHQVIQGAWETEPGANLVDRKAECGN